MLINAGMPTSVRRQKLPDWTNAALEDGLQEGLKNGQGFRISRSSSTSATR